MSSSDSTNSAEFFSTEKPRQLTLEKFGMVNVPKSGKKRRRKAVTTPEKSSEGCQAVSEDKSISSLHKQIEDAKIQIIAALYNGGDLINLEKYDFVKLLKK